MTDIGPCISVLEVKFIELFKKYNPKGLNVFNDNSEGSDESLMDDSQKIRETDKIIIEDEMDIAKQASLYRSS